MLSDKAIPNKAYYSIKEVCDFCQEEASVLRYWESEFKQLKPRKVNNQRRYNQYDISTILAIKTLLRDQRLTIADAKRQLGTTLSQTKPQAKPVDSETTSILGNLKADLTKVLKILG